jgi:hypothetical protein
MGESDVLGILRGIGAELAGLNTEADRRKVLQYAKELLCEGLQLVLDEEVHYGSSSNDE